jgi:hypothetical protein
VLVLVLVTLLGITLLAIALMHLTPSIRACKAGETVPRTSLPQEPAAPRPQPTIG